MSKLGDMFREFEEEQKRIPKKIIKPTPVKKIIKKEEIPEKIKVDRTKSKSQLMVSINRLDKKDQQRPKHKQKNPSEIYRAFELIFRILEKR